MRKWNNGVSGFTLIELLVVVIIVAVLAAVGLPLMSGNIDRAKSSEALAGLGTIRTNMRSLLAESAKYPSGAGFALGNSIISANIGMNPGDLKGRFFEDNDYTWGAAGSDTTYCASVTGDVPATDAGGNVLSTEAPRTGAGIIRSMNETGDIFTSNNCSGTAIN